MNNRSLQGGALIDTNDMHSGFSQVCAEIKNTMHIFSRLCPFSFGRRTINEASFKCEVEFLSLTRRLQRPSVNDVALLAIIALDKY